jgi:hypothetical protein
MAITYVQKLTRSFINIQMFDASDAASNGFHGTGPVGQFSGADARVQLELRTYYRSIEFPCYLHDLNIISEWPQTSYLES